MFAKRSHYLLASLLFLLQIYTFGQSKNLELDKLLSGYFNKELVPSISLGYAQHGKIQWVEAKGLSDIEKNIPVDINSVYRIASVSKTITAVAIMQLVEKGKLKLNDSAKKFLPEFANAKYDFTIMQLLNHTSGVRSYKKGEFDSNIHYKDFSELLKFIAKDTLQFKPGSDYLYSTLAYNLLGAIIERVAKVSFSTYVKDHIFMPAGMGNTYPDLQSVLVKNRAKGYDIKKNKSFINAPLVDLSIKIPGGGFISTTSDLLKFGIALLNGKLIKKSTLQLMIQPTKLSSGKISNYGLGIASEKDKAGNVYFHHLGGGTGFSSHLVIFPKEELVSVHLINIKTSEIGDPAMDLAKLILLPKSIKSAKK